MVNRRNRRGWQQKVSSRRLKEHRQGIIIFSFAALLATSLIFAYFYFLQKSESIDADTFCKKGIPEQVTVVLIDHTDQFNEVQKADLERELFNLANNKIPQNTWLKLIAVSADPAQLLKAEKPFCNPGDDRTVSNLTGNKQKAKKLYEIKYKKKIEGMLEEMLHTKSTNSSPIMEALQAVAVTTFKGEEAPVIKKLILVSDLLQHTDEFSMYNGIPDFSTFKQSAYWKKIKSNFSDVEVEILFIRRDGADSLQNSNLIKFWAAYFAEQDVLDFHSIPIDG